MRDVHEIALSLAEDAADALTRHTEVEVSILNYRLYKREVPAVLRILRADPRFAEVGEPGVLGYVRFKKAVLRLV